MIEEEIDVEGFTPDFERRLAADEGELAAKLQEKVTKMFEEAPLELPLSGGRAQGLLGSGRLSAGQAGP